MAKNFPFGLPELPVPELVPVVLEEAPKTERDWYEHLTELIYSIQGSRKRLSGRMRKVLRRHARRAARGLCAADGAVRSKVQIMGPDGPETPGEPRGALPLRLSGLAGAYRRVVSTIRARMLTAISAGLVAPIGSPTGHSRRATHSAGRPSSSIQIARTTLLLRRLPSMPIQPR